MDKIEKPRGLIRYDSEYGIKLGKKLSITPRMIGYSIVLTALVVGLGFGIGARSKVEVTILRAPGMMFQEVGADSISNLYNYKVVNKSREELPVDIVLENVPGLIKGIGNSTTRFTIKRDGLQEGTFFVVIPRDALSGRKNKIHFRVSSQGEKLENYSTNFLGPVK
jgi:polyferredoxin